MSCELPQAYSHETPVARKEHRCCECQGLIQPGERYHRHWGVWNGEAATYKVCEDCEALRSRVDKDEVHLDEKTAFGMLWQSALESHDREHAADFIAIRRKRDAAIADWMLKYERKREDEP